MNRRRRLLGFVWVFALLVWLPFEDTQLWWTVLLASAACAWLALRIAPRFNAFKYWQASAVGAALGASVPLIAISLMAFKSGLHGHGFADFTARQVWAVASALPYLLVMGALFGPTLRAVRVHQKSS